MKNLLTSTLATALCALILTACGGGGKKSGVKSNDLLGALPTIHADYKLNESSFKEKADKVKKSGNLKKMLQAAQKEAEEMAQRRAKFEEKTKAEWAKINGKDVPFSTSAEFDKLNIEVKSVKLDAEYTGFLVEVTAKDNFTVNRNNSYNYQQLNYRVLAKDGSEIDRTGLYLVYLGFDYSKSFTKGQSILFNDSPLKGNLALNTNTDKWANFASIEFITQDEYSK